ncbi:MAG TPA: hypothetical protein VF950_28855 [Planctomycetota bacterium]
MKRVLWLAAAAALLPACDDGDDGAAVLFSDDFNRSSAGPDWHVSAGTSIAPAQGSPAPGLAMAVSLGDSAQTAHTELSFTARPLTVAVDLDATTGEASGGVEIVTSAHAPLATAERFATPGGDMTFTIGAATQTVSLPSSPGVQKVTFSVDSLGNAAWSLGDTTVLIQPGFPTAPVSIQLFTRSGTTLPGAAFPTFVFDNVVVTSP